MIRSISMEHGQFRAVLREPRRIELRDFERPPFDSERVREYFSLGFPIWTRLDLRGIEIPDIKPSFEKCDLDWLIDEMDFEGADRKYTLMADIFHTEKICFNGKGEKEIEIEGDSIDTFLFVVEGNAHIRVRYSGGFRISNGRFLVKEGAKLIFEDSSFSDGIEISSYFFKLEKGAQIELKQGVLSSGKIAKYVLVTGEDFEASVLPRVGALRGYADVMYSSFVGYSSSVSVDGLGFSKEGKVIFRGVMDAKKGSKDAEVSEKFECIFMDESSSFEAIPSLFISENDLSAEHGASAYSIPYEELFYMMSRGIDPESAKFIVASGILEDFEELSDKLRAIW